MHEKFVDGGGYVIGFDGYKSSRRNTINKIYTMPIFIGSPVRWGFRSKENAGWRLRTLSYGDEGKQKLKFVGQFCVIPVFARYFLIAWGSWIHLRSINHDDEVKYDDNFR